MDKKVLVIDDNKDDLLLIQRYLKEADCNNIITAESGEEGVKKVKEERPDVVVLDTLLGKEDGFEVCSKIRKATGPTTPKIIIITGAIDAVDAVKAKKSGADDYCAKTSDCGLLLEAVKKLV